MADLTPRSELIAVGETVPDFTLTTDAREEWTLSDAVKKGDVVLCFFPFAFTSVCATEMKCITDEMSQWETNGATVVGVSCDSFAALAAWKEQMGYKQTLLSDIHRTVCKAMGLYWQDLNVASRGTVIIAQDASGAGKVTWSQGREPGSAMEWTQVVGQLA